MPCNCPTRSRCCISSEPIVFFDYGETPVGITLEREFVIENNGNGNLSIYSIDIPDGFTLIDPVVFPFTILPSGSDTITIRADVPSVGTFSGIVYIRNNAGAIVYSFGITVEATLDILSRDYFEALSTYFVDSVNGDDLNDGLTPLTPFENLTALPTLVSGDIVGLACGSSWLGQKIRVPDDNISIGSYVPPQTSNTTTPIIDSRDNETGWVTLGGATPLVFAKTVTFLADDMYDSSTWINVTQNGSFLTNVANAAACQALAGSYYVSSHNGTSITIGIHSTDDADPDTHQIRVTKKSHAIDARTANNITIFDVDCYYNLHKGGVIKVGENCLIDSCDLLNGSVHNVYLEQGSVISNCTVYGWYTTESQNFIVFNQNTPTGGDLTVTDCIIGDPSSWQTSAAGLYCHNNTSGLYGEFIISNCTFRNMGLAIDAFHVPLVTVTDCVFTNNTMISRLSYDDISFIFTNCQSTNSGQTSSWVETPSAITGASITLISCTFLGTRITNALFYITRDNVNITLTDCQLSLTNASLSNRQGIWLNGVATSGDITVNGTSFLTNGTNGWQRSLDFGALVASGFYVGDNNVFSGEFGYWLRQNNIEYANSQVNKSAQWIAATGQDTNSTFLL